ncbi:uncharacterized protein PV09_03281 [Verruconis gallopava]|uniref:peptidylprolyl isomerase n=1 Tax=Verruconis gallopava TaxID=253628 RepID=A0A0D2B4G2_9PEZI|nr:uncharacterized protein PV09_03281 [Verruconis gallopava]KIW06114.1 hypothetical protein PV09_03281 [Verruconis gallopava]
MQRYTVNFSAPGAPTRRLLVPFSASSPVKDFAQEVQTRLAKLKVFAEAEAIEFRLHDAHGPQIDPDDSLQDVVLNPLTENLHASVLMATASKDGPSELTQGQADPEKERSALAIPEDTSGGFHIRVITPATAQSGDISDIPLIPGRFSTTITIHQIRQLALLQLDLPLRSTITCDKPAYCNCAFANSLQSGTTFAIANDDHQLKSSFFFLHSAGEVVKLSCASGDQNSLLECGLAFAKERFGIDVLDDMCLTVIRSPDNQITPIVALCSKSKHRSHESSNSANEDLPVRLDLHTAEAPIDTPLSHLTMAELGLEDVLVDGVLNIYSLSRKECPGTRLDAGKGQATIFGAAPHWEPPIAQTERGMAVFLSSLRIVSNTLSGHPPDLNMQDAVLQLLHRLTNFPPCVRAMHVLIRNETPTTSECAAIAQAFYYMLEKYVPKRVTNFDSSRIFEASRLFFGLFLEKAKHLCRANSGETSLPYLTSLKPVTLINPETTEPLFFAVDTNVGLFEKGHLDAIKEGLIKFTDPSLGEDLTELSLDGRTRRAVLLSGGVKTKIFVFDTDFLLASGCAEDLPAQQDIIRGSEVELSQLSALCSRNNLSVVAPARLATSSSPALTLDGEGLLSCYLGRQPCSEPGKDFVIFRPTAGGDETIDIAIITKLLAPILEARRADGSAVFDAPGDVTQRKIDMPDEILMVCVDCSASMDSSAGFTDMVEDVPPQPASRPVLERLDLTAEADMLASPLDEVKEWLMAHESFEDIVRTVYRAEYEHQAHAAKALLEEIAYLATKELIHKNEQLSQSRRFTFAYRNPLEDSARSRVDCLKKLIFGVEQHQAALIDWIVFRSRMLSPGKDEWLWQVGNPVPATQMPPRSFESDSLDLAIPDDYRCAITHELMFDPVATADGHVYDRGSIQQWLQINRTSPKTGLELSSSSLTFQWTLMRDINKWIEGDSYRGPSTSGQGTLKVNFSSRLGTFARTLKASITCEELYHVAFQALRGRHASFDLKLQGRLNAITPSNDAATAKGLHYNCTVNIILQDTGNHTSNSTGDKCLIKVYRNTRKCHFSYWVPKDSDLSVASILFKYWRQRWPPEEPLTETCVWHNMKDSGDGHSTGYILNPWEKLKTYLTSTHARGSLNDEAVFDDPSAPYQGVLKIFIGRKPEKLQKVRTSRMDVLKQIFDQFVNRTIAYNYSTHLGLIIFDSTARVARQLSDVVEDFRATVNELKPSSDTAIWDGLALACHHLEQYGTRYPEAKKRILCISDGEDTKSSKDPASLCHELVRSNVVVDSFCLGKADHRKLLGISHLTGGYKFAPKTLSHAMGIVELEPVLALKDREDIPRPVIPRNSTMWSQFQRAQLHATPEIVTEDVYPKRPPHPNLKDDVIELAAAKRMAAGRRSGANMMRNSRLLTEIQNMMAKPHDYIDVYVSERDISFWKIVMKGPPDSPYASGTFLLYLDMDESYPTFAPKGRFVTPIYHVNINRNGRICHSIFDRNWTADTSCTDILNSVYGLLLVPDYSDPVNVVGTLEYHGDQVEFADAVRRHISKHASKSREEWRRELLGQS